MRRRLPRGWATARYGLVWLAAAAVVALGAAVLLDSGSEIAPADPEALEVAAREADCVLRRDTGATDAADVMQPPTFGESSLAAEPGVYETSPTPEQLVGALRRGVIVVQYRPRLAPELVRGLLLALDDRSPPTIITPDATGMRFTVAVTAWTRLLGCSHITPEVLDVAAEFRAHYANQAPGSP